ncbi:hypothetical protein Ahy_A03g017012 [Arachis hypogaea]|uniref:Protein FAR1-RELATED SEQUENCE n=1 Tax=Arachis hypogaea TaxID=3818 RepID=A0A445E521_ARAHY|nr:hypothetical protein Ahy_A03g017012 [Arachis hypogaea]
MDPSSSDCVLNPGEVDYEFESNEVPEPLSVVDDELVPKVGMTFTTLEDAGKFYRNYAKAASFSTRVREQAERESDAADFHTVIPCATKSSIEAQFQDAYTHAKFREVQAQFRGKANCITRLKNSALGYSVYKVGKQVSSSIFDKFAVTYDSVAAEELTAILHCAYDNVMAEMKALKGKRKGTSSLSHEDANLESVNELQSPPRIRTRGRPKNRLGSKLEKQIANATKKKKTKVLSKINLFDAASVAHSNCSQYQGQVINYQFRVPAAGDNSLGV